MTKTNTAPNGAIDFASLRPSHRRYEWFEMDREEGDDAEPLRVKVQRLTAAEIAEIPVDNTPIKQVVRDNKHCFVAWSLTAMSDTGDVVPVPPPAELDDASIDAVFEHLLHQDQVQWLYQVLKAGHMVRLVSQKKASMRSDATPGSPSAPASTDAT